MTYENVTVLLTGAAGLLGTWLRRTAPSSFAEELVSHRDPTSVIVRLPLIISADPEDHILADIRGGIERGEPSVWFSDEMRQPAYAEELCRAIWDIASVPCDKRAGVWHLPGPERLSRYEIADRTVAALGLDRSSIVSAVTPVEACRPRDLDLTGDRAKAQIAWCPTPIHTLTPPPLHDRSPTE